MFVSDIGCLVNSFGSGCCCCLLVLFLSYVYLYCLIIVVRLVLFGGWLWLLSACYSLVVSDCDLNWWCLVIVLFILKGWFY